MIQSFLSCVSNQTMKWNKLIERWFSGNSFAVLVWIPSIRSFEGHDTRLVSVIRSLCFGGCKIRELWDWLLSHQIYYTVQWTQDYWIKCSSIKFNNVQWERKLHRLMKVKVLLHEASNNIVFCCTNTIQAVLHTSLWPTDWVAYSLCSTLDCRYKLQYRGIVCYSHH